MRLFKALNHTCPLKQDGSCHILQTSQCKTSAETEQQSNIALNAVKMVQTVPAKYCTEGKHTTVFVVCAKFLKHGHTQHSCACKYAHTHTTHTCTHTHTNNYKYCIYITLQTAQMTICIVHKVTLCFSTNANSQSSRGS